MNSLSSLRTHSCDLGGDACREYLFERSATQFGRPVNVIPLRSGLRVFCFLAPRAVGFLP